MGARDGHRYQPVMVYDRARGRTVLCGGIGGPADTWEWDGARSVACWSSDRQPLGAIMQPLDEALIDRNQRSLVNGYKGRATSSTN